MLGNVAIVESTWHGDLVSQCAEAAIGRLAELGVTGDRVERVAVPGALEMPLFAQALASRGDVAAVACIALVVDGGIYRHDFVASAVLNGLVRVGLDSGVPVLSAVLTPQQFREGEPHLEFFASHLRVKGVELADAIVGSVTGLAAVSER